MSKIQKGYEDLVYGVYQVDEIVFMPRQEAEDKAKLWRAIGTAETWAEFKQAAPSRFYAEVVENLIELDEMPEPDGQTRFKADDIPCHADGDWPSWPAQEMLDWVPKEVQERFGERYATTLNGDYLYLPGSAELAIVTVMEAFGYKCTRDDDLVKAANGRG